MIHKLTKLLRRQKEDESGSASVEFVLVFPAFLWLILVSIELGYITLRHTLLVRGVDMAVRELRLGTGNPSSHMALKQLICENAGYIYDCDDSLQLEMISADLRAYNSMSSEVLCTDASEDVNPITLNGNLEFGQPNELMLLRACYKYYPLFPSKMLGSALGKDANGQASVITMTAFVQEPL